MFEHPAPSLEFDGSPPEPARLQPTPDELHAFLSAHHKGLHRIAVKLFIARRRYSNVGAIKVGAAFEQIPDASVETLCAGVMAICSDYHETVDRDCKFLIQVYVHRKPTGDPVRKGLHIEIGTDRAFGGAFSEGIEDPTRIDDVLLGHIRQCHAEILAQAQVISEVGKAAIRNASEVFVAKEEAIQARAEVLYTIQENRAAEMADKAKQQTKDKMVAIFEQGMGMALQQFMASRENDSPPKTDENNGQSYLAAAQTVSQTKNPEPKKKEQPVTLASRLDKIFSGLTATQIKDVQTALTKAQFTMLEKARASTSDDDTRALIAKFRASLMKSPARLLKLGQALPVSAQTDLLSLADAGS